MCIILFSILGTFLMNIYMYITYSCARELIIINRFNGEIHFENTN